MIYAGSASPRRAALRGARRGPLPAKRLPGPGVGGGHHPRPAGVDLVCLSATVSNAEELADWIRTVRGETAAVIEDRRPVELHDLYLLGDRRSERLFLLPDPGRRPAQPRGSAPSTPRPCATPGCGAGPEGRLFTPRRAEVVELLGERGHAARHLLHLQPGRLRRRRGPVRAGRPAADHRRGAPPDPGHRRSPRRGLVATTTCACSATPTWMAGLEAGFAAHHAGLVPPFKEAVEACFAAGLVKVVFATETLSLGINMPARSVVIEKLTKFTGERHEFLTPGEYTQLTGRAGRRGIDDVGYAIVLWSPFVPFDQVAGLVGARTYALTSSFRPTYNMAANLVRRYPPDVAHHLLNLSFAQYRADSDVVRLESPAGTDPGGADRSPGRRHLRAGATSRSTGPAPDQRGHRPASAVDDRARCWPRWSRSGRATSSSFPVASRAGGWRCCRPPAGGAVTSGCGPSPPIGGCCPSARATSPPRPEPWPGWSCRPRTPRTTPASSATWPRPSRAARLAGGRPGRRARSPAHMAGRGGHGPGRSAAASHPGGRLPRRPRTTSGRWSGPIAWPRRRASRAADQGPDRVAGPAVRPGPAGARSVGLRRRVGADRRRASGWPGSTTRPTCSSPSACTRACSTGSTPAEMAGLVSVFTFEARGHGEEVTRFPPGRLRERWSPSTGWPPSSTTPRTKPGCP